MDTIPLTPEMDGDCDAADTLIGIGALPACQENRPGSRLNVTSNEWSSTSSVSKLASSMKIGTPT